MINYVIIIILFLLILLIYKFSHFFVFLPKDNTNKIQSINQSHNTFLLNIIIILPFLFKYFDISFLIPIFFILIVGLLDDIYNLSVTVRFISVLFILIIFLCFNQDYHLSRLIINDYEIEIGLYSGISISLFLLMGFIHVMNMSDGRNGLVISYLLLMPLYIIYKKDFDLFHIDLILILFLMIFLNFKNISYLGNNGLLVISVVFGSLLFKYYNEGIIYIREVFILFFIPFFDGVYVTIKRILNKKNLFEPDRNHLHHLPKKNEWYKCLFYIIMFKLILLLLFYHFANLNFIFLFILAILGYIALRLRFNS